MNKRVFAVVLALVAVAAAIFVLMASDPRATVPGTGREKVAAAQAKPTASAVLRPADLPSPGESTGVARETSKTVVAATPRDVAAAQSSTAAAAATEDPDSRDEQGVALDHVTGTVVLANRKPAASARVRIYAHRGRGAVHPGSQRELDELPVLPESLFVQAIHHQLSGSLVLVGTGTTDDSGEFSIAPVCRLMDGNVIAAATLEPSGKLAAFGAVVKPLGFQRQGVLDLERIVVASIAMLRVVVRAQGAVVVGARLLLSERIEHESPGTWNSTAEATTDENGVHERTTTAEEVRVVVQKAGFATEVRRVRIEGATTVEIDLDTEFPFRGRVVDRDGKGIAAVTIAADEQEVVAPGTELPWQKPGTWVFRANSGRAETDANGDYQLHGLAQGRRFRLSAQPRSRVLLPAEKIVTPPGENGDFTLGPAGGFVVDVVSTTPLDVEAKKLFFEFARTGIQLEEWDESAKRFRARAFPAGAEPGDDGMLPVAQVTPGVYRVTFEGDFRHGAGASDPVTVKEGETTAKTVLDLRRNRSVTGRVVDEHGAPIQGASIEGNPGQTWIHSQTDETGTFRVDGLRIDVDVPLVASKGPKDSVKFTAPAGKTTIPDVIFAPAARRKVSGRVVDTSGAPVAGARVGIEFDLPNSRTSYLADVDESGRYEIEVPTGPGRCRARARGYKEATIELGANDTSAADIALAPE